MRTVPQTNNSDLSPTLRLVSTRALVLTGGTGAAVALADKGSMICRASVGASVPALGCQLDVTSGFSGECVRIGKALRCDDSETDPRVDVASCRRLGIRSILAAPIHRGRDVIGLLEVFSTHPFAFDDGHLVVVERLAQTALPTLPTLATTPPPKLLVEKEPAHRVFLRNLIDVLLPPRVAPLKLTSTPAPFWTDVFVSAQLPWERFLQSIFVHVIMILAIGSALEFWLAQQHSVRRLAFSKSDVIYYSPSEYLQALRAERVPMYVPRRQQSIAKQPAIRVPRERDRRTPTEIAPPNVKMKHELRLLQLVAFNSVSPAVPLSATTRTRMDTPGALSAVVAPPPEISRIAGTRTSNGLNPAAVIGPPPEVSAISSLRAPTVQSPAVIGPPPEVASISRPRTLTASSTDVIGPPPEIASISKPRALITPPAAVIGPPPPTQQLVRQIGGINAGYVQVVAPAPRVSLHQQGALSAMVQAGLRGSVASVVPPPPSVSGAGTGSPGRQGANTLSAAATQVALPPAVVRNAGDSVGNGGGSAMPGARPLSAPASREAIDDSSESSARTREMSVSFVGLALALPSSSYFSSHEVFLAEDRLSRYRSRLIKLIYEYLPYQPRLSDYGPNYPALDNLRVTRDPTCDETLVQVMSSVNIPGQLQSGRLQDLKAADKLERLECYRTTADDYRRAQASHR